MYVPGTRGEGGGGGGGDGGDGDDGGGGGEKEWLRTRKKPSSQLLGPEHSRVQSVPLVTVPLVTVLGQLNVASKPWHVDSPEHCRMHAVAPAQSTWSEAL